MEQEIIQASIVNPKRKPEAPSTKLSSLKTPRKRDLASLAVLAYFGA